MIIYTLSKTVSADAPSLFFLLYPCGIDDDTTQLRQISLRLCTVRYCAFLQDLEALTIAIVCPVGYGLDSRSFIEFFWNLKKQKQTAINLLSRREKTMRQRRTFDRKSPFNY